MLTGLARSQRSTPVSQRAAIAHSAVLHLRVAAPPCLHCLAMQQLGCLAPFRIAASSCAHPLRPSRVAGVLGCDLQRTPGGTCCTSVQQCRRVGIAASNAVVHVATASLHTMQECSSAPAMPPATVCAAGVWERCPCRVLFVRTLITTPQCYHIEFQSYLRFKYTGQVPSRLTL